MDVLFLLAGSADATLEGFQRAKAFLKRFVRAALTGDSRARVGVALYSAKLTVAVPVVLSDPLPAPSLAQVVGKADTLG